MASIVYRERVSSPLPLPLVIPLTEPSVDVAMSFLHEIVPGTVFSAGSGRRRRRPLTVATPGRRSDTGYLVFYQAPAGAPVRQTPLKSPPSIQAYLEAQIAAPVADHWVALQSTQFRARRDGKAPGEGFTSSQARHLLCVVVDLDGQRMAAAYRNLLQTDLYGFRAVVDGLLSELGIQYYRLVRSGPTGAHVYIPLIRPDGMPLRATERNLAAWERVSEGLHRHLEQLGADPYAAKATQPFVIPGLPRAKHPGFIPYPFGGRTGARADLYALLRSLGARKLIMRRAHETMSASVMPAEDTPNLLAEVVEKAKGIRKGDGRNPAAHSLATYLLVKGASATQTWAALERWNQRNTPPLPRSELRRCFKSALRSRDRHPRKWAQMQAAPWTRLRRTLGLPTGSWHRQRGRWRPLTPARSWETRKLNGGREHYHELTERLLSHLAAQGGSWKITQGELARLIGAALSSLKEVLKALRDRRQIEVITKRGRGGSTLLRVLPSPPPSLDIKCPVSLTPNGVESGARVGPGESEGNGELSVRCSQAGGSSAQPSRGVVIPLRRLSGAWAGGFGAGSEPVIAGIQKYGFTGAQEYRNAGACTDGGEMDGAGSCGGESEGRRRQVHGCRESGWRGSGEDAGVGPGRKGPSD